jgi:peroxiredoxin
MVLLVSISLVAYLEWSANRRSSAAISELNALLGKEDGDLLSMELVEALLGRKPDGPVVEENGALKATYTWKGVFRQYPLIAVYKKQSPPKLLRIWMAGEEPPAAEAHGVGKFRPNPAAARQAAEWQKRREAEGRALEDAVKSKPDDLESRVKLLQYYMTQQDRPAARKARVAHVVWLVENQPGNPAAGSVYALLHPRQDGDAYDRVKGLWDKQVEAHPRDRAILANAAAFLRVGHPDEARALLERRRQLEPQGRLALQKGAQLRGRNPEGTTGEDRQGVETVKLRPFASGATARVGGYMPQQLRLKADRPTDLAKAPDLAAPLFGVIALGPGESPTRVVVALDEPEGQPSRLLVDANANGDLTDDPAPVWTSRASKSQDGRTLTMFHGNASILLEFGGASLPARFDFYRFDRNDPARTALKESLFYYADYGYEGEITLGDTPYPALLVDRLATGDFRGKAGPGFSGVQLMIDVNKNGRFDRQGEGYDVRKPFNIGGTTYEIAGLTASGGEFRITKSDTFVAEVLPPPDLSTGQKAIQFTARTTDDQEVNFPSTYAGKLVLLDFWATWCGPCIAELPHLTRAYETFHDKGLEVLGISLDQPGSGDKVASFTREKQMPWRQVYDGKFWKAEVATLYAVHSIPQAYLVDGDAGVILAAGAALRGEQLGATISAALRKKGLLKPGDIEVKAEPPPTPASVTTLLEELRSAGNTQLASELTREIEQARAEVDRYQKMSPSRPGHVIVGRLVGEGLDDASRVIAQMAIHREGHFVAAVGASGRPVGFRKQGYLPTEVTPAGAPGSVEDVGEVRLQPTPEAMRAAIKGKLEVEGAASINGARATLTLLMSPINTLSGGYTPRVADSRNVTLTDSGEFSVPDLSPLGYLIRFEAPGGVGQYRPASPKPGETLDLGTIRLEKPLRVTVSYREAPSPPFTAAAPKQQAVLGGGPFLAGTARGSAYDVRFDQSDKQIRFSVGYGPCQLADLGPGTLEDFLQVDPASVRLSYPTQVAAQPGHVYLLDQKFFKHWVLFQFKLDPEAPQ